MIISKSASEKTLCKLNRAISCFFVAIAVTVCALSLSLSLRSKMSNTDTSIPPPPSYPPPYFPPPSLFPITPPPYSPPPPASVGDDDTTNSNNNHDDGVGDGTESCHSDDSTNTVAHFIDAGMDAGLISPRTAVFDALIAFRSQSVLMQAQMETVERQNVELQFKRHLVVAMRTKMSLFSSSSS